MQRYWVERAFQNVKGYLGIHQYQVRSWTASYHHIALSIIFYSKSKKKVDKTLLSIPDSKLIFAKKLINKLIPIAIGTDEGLAHAIKLRHKKRMEDIQKYFRKNSNVPK